MRTTLSSLCGDGERDPTTPSWKRHRHWLRRRIDGDVLALVAVSVNVKDPKRPEAERGAAVVARDGARAGCSCVAGVEDPVVAGGQAEYAP